VVSDRLERADAIGALGLLLVVAPIVLWGRDRGLSGLLDVEQGWRNVGLLTGLLASIFMVMQVLLIARIPWIERSWGHDVLAHRHRWLGFWSFWLMISHIVAFTVEHATRFKMPSLLDSLVDTFFLRPWMVWASLGASLVVVVVVTSIRYARAKMRYESWHLLHLYAYAGMGFALPHQIFKGPDFRGPAAQVYWWSVYALAVSAIVVFRLITPIYRTIYHRLRVTAVTEERPDVVSITMTGRHLDRLKPRAGQFFIWRFLDGPGWMRGHPFSLSDTPSNDRLRVTIQACGDGSSRAARIRVGALVAIEGPFGTMTLDRRRHQQVVFVAAGVGIAPLRALIGETHFTAGEATLIYRYSAREHAIFLDEVGLLAETSGLEIVCLPGGRRSDGSWLPEGRLGDDHAVLHDLIPDIARTDIYVCGPPVWLKAVTRAALRAGAARHHIHSEDFAW
jgi:predicted ferric reductase